MARLAGQVVFVRHAAPGERVLAEVTEVRRGHLRAETVAVREASPDRVTPPCGYARPGGCGGCDLQHLAPPAQRNWKAAVVREQLRRLGGLSEDEIAALGVEVVALPGGMLGWRTRVRYSVDGAGRAGLLAHRSHRVVPVDRCLLAHPAVRSLDLTGRRWPGVATVAAVADATGAVSVRADDAPVSGPHRLRERAAGRQWALPPEVFWQVHPAAADTLVDAVVELLTPRASERAWDLYGGVGLFAAALADRGVAVTLVETAAAAAATARAHLPEVRVVQARVEAASRRGRLPRAVDLVVLDPPRAGAGAEVVRAVVAARPRAVAYVACDPAAFARDVRTFRAAGWSLTTVRAYDCFPMTHHVELVGLLVPAAGRGAPPRPDGVPGRPIG